MMSTLQKKILIVEDDLTMRRLIEVCLRALPAAQVAVTGGKAALEVLRREKIDLVVTDYIMPEAHGLDVVRSMRANPQLCEIPVVLLSCLGNPAFSAEAQAAGVQAYFMKPFSPTQFVATARRLLAL